MTTITSDEAANRLETAIVELEDLQKHWDSLAWWERNASLENVFDLIFDIQYIPEYAKRCELIQDKAEELDVENMADYPSDEALKNDTEKSLLYAGNPRLNVGICIGLMQVLSPDEIEELASHMGIDSEDHLDVLLKLNNRSMSAYYSLRNKIGDMLMYQCSQARKESLRCQKVFRTHYDLT